MSIKYDTIYAAHVRRVAEGVEDNPDTYILLDKACVPIRTGLTLSLFMIVEDRIRDLGWVEVERARVVDKDEVEFVLVRLRAPSDRLTGERHLLVVKRPWAAAGWSTRCMAARFATFLRGLTSSVKPIKRFIPPVPSVTPSLPPSPVPSNPPPASLTVSITIEQRRSVETPSLSSVLSRAADMEFGSLEADAASAMYAEDVANV